MDCPALDAQRQRLFGKIRLILSQDRNRCFKDVLMDDIPISSHLLLFGTRSILPKLHLSTSIAVVRETAAFVLASEVDV